MGNGSAGREAPGNISTVPFPVPDTKWQPKRLTPKHRQILSLYAQGMKREEIGNFCHCTPALVTMLARTDIGRAYLQSIEETMDQRLRALYSKTIDAIDDQLCNGRGADKIAAAKLQLQATGKLGTRQEETETAEDVIQRILALQINGDVNINVQVPPMRTVPGQGGGDVTDQDIQE